MDIAACYRLLELNVGASVAEIKEAYRRLARQYHPDSNPSDEGHKDKFIALVAAYELLTSVVQPVQPPELSSNPVEPDPVVVCPPPTVITVIPPPPTPPIPPLSEVEQQIKCNSYQQLQRSLKEQKFSKAIALVESLAQRFPQDPEVRQWQALVYHRWGRQLLNQKQLDKARIYLKKALKTDPHNASLGSEVERDFRRMERIF